jgi:hypothetical protein
MDLNPVTVWMMALIIGFAGGFGGVFCAAVLIPALVAVGRFLSEFCIGTWIGLTRDWR